METLMQDFVRKALAGWFENQLGTGCSPTETAKVAEVCLMLDVAQVLLGYDDEEMSEADPELRDICNNFIKRLEQFESERAAKR